jgi:hypothetical protein
MTTAETAEAILVAHQRRDYRGCLCGWSELGKSHPGHQVAMLREAGLLAQDEADSTSEPQLPPRNSQPRRTSAKSST